MPDFSEYHELKEDELPLANAMNAAWWINPNAKLRRMGQPVINDPLMDVPWAPAGVLPISMMDSDLVE